MPPPRTATESVIPLVGLYGLEPPDGPGIGRIIILGPRY